MSLEVGSAEASGSSGAVSPLSGVSPLMSSKRKHASGKRSDSDRRSPPLSRITETPEAAHPRAGPFSVLLDLRDGTISTPSGSRGEASSLPGGRSRSPKPERPRSGSAKGVTAAEAGATRKQRAPHPANPDSALYHGSTAHVDPSSSPPNGFYVSGLIEEGDIPLIRRPTSQTTSHKSNRRLSASNGTAPDSEGHHHLAHSMQQSPSSPQSLQSVLSDHYRDYHPELDGISAHSASSFNSPPSTHYHSPSPSPPPNKAKRPRSSSPNHSTIADLAAANGTQAIAPPTRTRTTSSAQKLIEAKLGGNKDVVVLPSTVGPYEPSVSESEGHDLSSEYSNYNPTADLVTALQPMKISEASERAYPTMVQSVPSSTHIPAQTDRRSHGLRDSGKTSISPESPFLRSGSIPLSLSANVDRQGSGLNGAQNISVSISPGRSRADLAGASPPAPKISKKGRTRSLSGIEGEDEELTRGRSIIPSSKRSSARSRSTSPMSYMGEGRLLTNTATRTPAPVVEDFFIMEDALVHYKLLEKLGKGSFGNVYIAKLRKDKTNRRFAIKKSLIDSRRRMQTMCREIGNLRNANHKNVIQFISSYFHKDIAWIVMEFCDAGTLRDLRYCTTLKEAHIAYIMREMLFGLEYMHHNGMMHRDLKGENVLLSADGEVKIADLGLAVPAQEDQKRIAGSKYWMAPEMILAAGYGPKADIYSLGATAYELADGLPPYAQYSAIRALFCAAKFGFPPLDCPNAWSKDFLSFLSVCTHPNPRDRPSCTELLKHPFLNKACAKADFAKLIAAAFAMENYSTFQV